MARTQWHILNAFSINEARITDTVQSRLVNDLLQVSLLVILTRELLVLAGYVYRGTRKRVTAVCGWSYKGAILPI